ncbi:MAG: hypothetical protein COT17_06380 [Elusimicrobia bacterium CG08_land_8_20_14_0_20_51_18]|nr:MAG: hypothetical protein COT17_06380 [Elusimicrobia bacterium CG08_land_8_20_14_0_20_51_18]
MKKNIAVLSLLIFSVPAVYADSFEDFKTQIQAQGEALLTPFAEDFGGIIGGNDFHSGRALGFPGFEVGLGMTVQARPSEGNRILRDAGVDAFGMPLLSAGVGLPLMGTDVVVRGFSYSGLSVIGGGLRYNIFKSGVLAKFMPDLSASAFYDSINYDYFKGNHMSLNLVASFDIPVIKPFAGVGIDRTKLEIKNVSALLDGVDASISKPRYTLGVSFTLLPLTYLYGAYSSLHGQAAYNAGFGARF